ncbi:TetR/AcrR family transcriptional regulator [Conexibacter sp. W3-3-2]|uniref:TetR/AcrR family transcriptional regulator n=1 Tax=Conexibacter sp. W3-3-2 TaxID=2675227 RepID=UPI0018AA3DA8
MDYAGSRAKPFAAIPDDGGQARPDRATPHAGGDRSAHGRASFAEVSVDQITRRAGVSRPTFYAYFRDKRDLVLRLGEALERDVAASAAPWLEASQGSPRSTLEAVLGAFTRHRSTVRALVETVSYDAEVAAFWHLLHERFLQSAELRITREAPGIDPEVALARAYVLVWMTERVFTEHLSSPRVDEGRLLDALDAVWKLAIEPE